MSRHLHERTDCVYNLIIKSHSSRVGSEEERAIAKLTPKSMLGTITCTLQFHIFKVHTHIGFKTYAECLTIKLQLKAESFPPVMIVSLLSEGA